MPIRYLRVLLIGTLGDNEELGMVKKIGVMTSGGDCPGLNAVIRAVVRRANNKYKAEAVGVLRGWLGLMDGLVQPLTGDSVTGILPRGGTILRTSRTNPFIHDNGPDRIMENFKRFELDALIAIGGEDTMGVASALHKDRGLRVIGVPKAIDNDVWGTEYAFGFDTTCNIAMEAIDRIHTTAESHDRVMVIEVMGRDAGWIALYAGIAGGADMILIPERPVGVTEVCELIRRRHDRGKDYTILVVAEGASVKDRRTGESRRVAENGRKDEFGHPRLGGIGKYLAEIIEEETSYETRVTVLGHIQRGGSPSAFDRVLGSRFGMVATDLAVSETFGKMVALQSNRIVAVPLADVAGKLRTVPDELYEVATPFFG
jgi:6-phosphofructokinase 1